MNRKCCCGAFCCSINSSCCVVFHVLGVSPCLKVDEHGCDHYGRTLCMGLLCGSSRGNVLSCHPGSAGTCPATFWLLIIKMHGFLQRGCCCSTLHTDGCSCGGITPTNTVLHCTDTHAHLRTWIDAYLWGRMHQAAAAAKRAVMHQTAVPAAAAPRAADPGPATTLPPLHLSQPPAQGPACARGICGVLTANQTMPGHSYRTLRSALCVHLWTR